MDIFIKSLFFKVLNVVLSRCRAHQSVHRSPIPSIAVPDTLAFPGSFGLHGTGLDGPAIQFVGTVVGTKVSLVCRCQQTDDSYH